ncbi:MinD/ParA family protein [Halomarina halobia]|uniref:MinD/ParA family protein n=1 Tax=Halomarina halobia TaxID=3033386 RepID=A0ABD6A980_9EURY|nr:MinD/ParA family protein [Halomarina sp. PSR21]
MTGQVYAIAGGKGGVGKTTTTANLAAAFAAAGYDTVVIDVDLGMANLGPVLDVDPDEETTIHDVLAGRADPTAAARASGEGFDVVPGTQSLDGFAEADPANLREVVTPLAEEYDVVLLDTSAGLSHEVTVPLGLADAVVLLTTPDIVAIKDAAKTGELAKRVGGTVKGIVLNRARDDELTDRVVDELGDEIMAIVPDDAAITTGRTVARPGSEAARAYNALAAALLGVDALEETAAAYAFPDPPEPATVEADALDAAVVPVEEVESESETDPAGATGGTGATGAGEAGEGEADADAGTTDASDATPDDAVAEAEAEAEATPEGRIEESDSDVAVDAVATAAGPVTTSAFEEDADAEMGGSFLDDDDDEKRKGALGRLRGLFE